MKAINETQQAAIFNFLNGLKTDINITDYVNIEDIDFENAFDSIEEKLNDENGFSIDIIYYASAMEYLRENDPSLKESLELAKDMGFELGSLSSEVLASLLASENARNDFNDLRDEIEEFFSDLCDELEEEGEEIE